MRLLLDTNLLARAASGPPGLANRLLIEATRPAHALVVSQFLLSELSRVLRYPRLQKTHGMNDEAIDQFLRDLQTVAEVVVPAEEPIRVVVNDPQDDPVVAAAIAGKVAAICTLDRHLHDPAVVAFCQKQSIDVLTDIELLARLRQTADS